MRTQAPFFSFSGSRSFGKVPAESEPPALSSLLPSSFSKGSRNANLCGIYFLVFFFSLQFPSVTGLRDWFRDLTSLPTPTIDPARLPTARQSSSRA